MAKKSYYQAKQNTVELLIYDLTTFSGPLLFKYPYCFQSSYTFLQEFTLFQKMLFFRIANFRLLTLFSQLHFPFVI